MTDRLPSPEVRSTPHPAASSRVSSDRPQATPASPPIGRMLLAFLTWNALWWGVVGAFAAPVTPGGWLSVAVAGAVSVLPLAPLARIYTDALYPSAALRVWVLRPFWYVQLALPIGGLAALLAALAGLPFGASRAAGLWTLAATTGVYALASLAGYWGSRRLVVRHLEAGFSDLPEGLDGLRIAQLSDLHVGPHTRPDHQQRICAAVERAKPDLIVYTGDQVDDQDRDVEHFARTFGGLRAPLGVFAVAGNHDVYAGWHGVRDGLERMGVTVLVNDAAPVERAGATMWVAGTGDPAGRHWTAEGGASAAPDVERTLAGIPEGAFTLALAHNPVLWPALASRGVHLTLSGHTHHGQFSIPPLNWCLASPFLKHAMGSHQRGASLLYINPGTNYWGIPLRLGAWPEVTVVTLRRSETGIREAGSASRRLGPTTEAGSAVGAGSGLRMGRLPAACAPGRRGTRGPGGDERRSP